MADTGDEVDERHIIALVGLVQGVQVIPPKDRGYDRHRITGLKQGQIHQQPRCSPVAVNEWMDGHKILASSTSGV